MENERYTLLNTLMPPDTLAGRVVKDFVAPLRALTNEEAFAETLMRFAAG